MHYAWSLSTSLFLFDATYPCMQQLHCQSWYMPTWPLTNWNQLRNKSTSGVCSFTFLCPYFNNGLSSSVPSSMQLDLEAFVEFLWSTEKLSALGAFWVESKLLTKQNNKKKKYGIRNYIVKEKKKSEKIQECNRYWILICLYTSWPKHGSNIYCYHSCMIKIIFSQIIFTEHRQA